LTVCDSPGVRSFLARRWSLRLLFVSKTHTSLFQVRNW